MDTRQSKMCARILDLDLRTPYYPSLRTGAAALSEGPSEPLLNVPCEVKPPLSRYLAHMMVRYASGVIVPLKCRRGHQHLNFSVQGLCDTQDFPGRRIPRGSSPCDHTTGVRPWIAPQPERSLERKLRHRVHVPSPTMKVLFAILALGCLPPGASPALVVAPRNHSQVKAAKRKPHRVRHTRAHKHHKR
ncbi:MAG: hypothetical protein JWP08_3809 [Bryobacterales bacterium]|nr:hypothetical protein [Bryobacterales bacterium]